MFKYSFLLVCLFSSILMVGQELNCEITINYEQVSQTRPEVFKTLERSLKDFVNKTKWTDRVFKENEKINCRMFIIVSSGEADSFQATIQVQSTRPVYNTSYESPIFNYKDNAFSFVYQEFQPLIFNANSFESNLVAVVSYYAYIILGLDADTFTLQGGNDNFRKAQNIVTQAQGSNFPGWTQESGSRSRFELVDNLSSNTFKEYRIAMYNYHRKGLDILADNNSTGKQVISGSLRLFETLIKRRPNAFLIQTFFDAKAEEIQRIFSDGPKVDIVKLKKTLNSVAPFYSNIWNEIEY